MKSKYHTIIKSILKSEGINANSAKVENLLRSTSLDPIGNWSMHTFIRECILAGRKLAGEKV